jgi:CRISPR/Cas system-associated exonuclease Cas4 (RecB family)
LQHALYGLAAVELLKARYKKPRVTAGVYYFSSHKGRQEQIKIPSPAQASIVAVLGDLRDVILTGHFTRTPDENNCRYCDYVAACGSQANIQAGRKVADPRFQAFRRLAAHE